MRNDKNFSTLSFGLAATAEGSAVADFSLRIGGGKESSEFRVKDEGELICQLSSCRRRQGFVSVVSFGKPLLLPIENFNGADGVPQAFPSVKLVVNVVNGPGRFLPCFP